MPHLVAGIRIEAPMSVPIFSPEGRDFGDIMRLLDRPVKLPVWVWSVLALLLLAYFGSPWTNYTQSRECRRICRAEGFADSRFKPQYRSKTGPQPSSCHCLSEAERRMKDRIPQGTRVF